MIFQQVCIQVPQMHLDLEVYRVDPDVGCQGMQRGAGRWNWALRGIMQDSTDRRRSFASDRCIA